MIKAGETKNNQNDAVKNDSKIVTDSNENLGLNAKENDGVNTSDADAKVDPDVKDPDADAKVDPDVKDPDADADADAKVKVEEDEAVTVNDLLIFVKFMAARTMSPPEFENAKESFPKIFKDC